MNEEIDESEFYHQDFTTASEWEIFIARVEEIIHEWKVDSNKGEKELKPSQKWSIQTECLPFADVDFTLTHYKKSTGETPTNDEDETKSTNPIETNFDFTHCDGTETHPDSQISTWYGFNEYIVLSTVNQPLILESRIKILLSSLHIVAGNANCEIPLFVQIREKWQKCYLGVYEGNGVRTNFEMVHLRRGPQHCQYLTGLVDLFKTKIMSPVPLDAIIVSVQLTHTLSDFGNYTWKQDLLDGETDNFDANAITTLPLGVSFDPIENIILKATWSQIPDNLIVDSENYSNFDIMQAPKWAVLVRFTEQPVCLLTDSFIEFTHLLSNNLTMYDILGDFAAAPVSESNPLDVLTESKVPTITSVLKRAARNSLSKPRRGAAPLSEDILVPMLYYMFPDAEEDSQNCYADRKDNAKFEERFRGFKTCGIDSLVWRLAVVLAQALQNLGGSRAMAHLWFEFTQEMRFRWEKNVLIPGIAPGFPDPRTCLLHQKLQMLNCCIERKKSRETSIKQRVGDSFGSSSDEEEFFDCTPENSDEERAKEKHSLWNQPVGRLGKFEDLKLLRTGDPLYIPVTQDPVPKTEDQLDEDTDFLLKLGSDATGSELRARMMSASLLSDMESFKAANPGSILEDFIRWYSPRDWIEEEGVDEYGQRKGRLSSRMLISDNTWVDTWKSAKPVPANRQKRLFDDTREAEKVLHFLDQRTMAQVAEMLLPVLAQSAISRIADESEQINVELHNSAEALQHLIKTAEMFSRQISTRRFDILSQEMNTLELSLSQANSLMYKFNPPGANDEELNLIVGELIKGREIEVGKDSTIGKRLISLFTEAQKASSMILSEQESKSSTGTGVIFPQAAEREFVMRVGAHRPAAYSAKSPQLLRAVLSKNEFRLVGAFSEDIVFF